MLFMLKLLTHSKRRVQTGRIVQSVTVFVKMVDEAKVKYICDIYDWDGKGEIDLFFLGDVMYALGLNITKKVSGRSITALNQSEKSSQDQSI